MLADKVKHVCYMDLGWQIGSNIDVIRTEGCQRGRIRMLHARCILDRVRYGYYYGLRMADRVRYVLFVHGRWQIGSDVELSWTVDCGIGHKLMLDTH